jgi:hypothetical protein
MGRLNPGKIPAIELGPWTLALLDFRIKNLCKRLFLASESASDNPMGFILSNLNKMKIRENEGGEK